jgi:hypothetical protein
LPILRTNRDLYLAITQLAEGHKSNRRSLEEYLRALLHLASFYAGTEALSLAEFYCILADAFTRPAPLFEEQWREEYDKLDTEKPGYVGWRATIIRQIVDLREMDEASILANEHRYFGVSAPRKSYWYNFDPVTFLECGMVGSFGGCEPDDESGRQFVPGKVAILGEHGAIISCKPEDIERPVFDMAVLKWEHVKDFMMSGQMYE